MLHVQLYVHPQIASADLHVLIKNKLKLSFRFPSKEISVLGLDFWRSYVNEMNAFNAFDAFICQFVQTCNVQIITLTFLSPP